jgi:L-asparaginase
MIKDPASGELKPFDFSYLANEIPELKKFNCTLDAKSLGEAIDSSDMTPEVWEEIAEIIFQNYNNYTGFVVLHGSDTMAFTASALSYMLQGLKKPIILTGSQLPIGAVRSDGKENLITAIEIALAKQNNESIIQEVAIYFEYKLYRGNRTQKIDAQNFQAFSSFNYPLLAEAGVDVKYNYPYLFRSDKNELTFKKGFVSDVAVIKFYPGISQDYVTAVLSSNCKAIIIETFGAGNVTTDKWLIDELKKQIDNNKIILNVTQCNGGMVEQGKYATSKQLKEIGVVSARDMTFEAAVTKLMFLLSQEKETSYVIKKTQEPIAGEITL